MKTITLSDRPDLFSKVISLIEKEFNYPLSNSFTEDFYPLINEGNFHNCHLLIEEDKVIGHIGVRETEILGLPIIFLGGIAITSSHQGKGLFSSFFEKTLSSYQDCAFYLLWSDKHSLYEKFHFSPAVKLYEYDRHESQKIFNYAKTDLKDFFKKDLSLVKENVIQPLRSKKDIELFSHIKSVDVYIKEIKNSVTDYFFVNKGADLQNIIHESFFSNIDSFEEALSKFECWSPELYPQSHPQEVASCLIRIGNHGLFKAFIHKYTQSQIDILGITKKVIHFAFLGENLNLEPSEFLQGILGPNEFEEIKDLKLKPLFIPGIESI